MLRRDTPRVVCVALVLLAVLTGLNFAHGAFRLGGSGSRLFEDWIYDAVMVGGAATCLARGMLIDRSRTAWLILGLGLSCDASGEILASFGESSAIATQDVLYVMLYLASYVAVVLLGRERVSRFRASMWLDGIIGICAVGALASVALLTPSLVATHATVLKAGLDVAFPLTDVLLVGIVILMLALGGWSAGRAFTLIATGFVVMALADGVYLYQEAHGGYVAGTPLDCLWLLSALMLALAAWQPDTDSSSERESSIVIMAAPVIFATSAIGVLLYANARGVNGLSISLAVATLLAVLVRLLITANENLRLVASSNELANHDALTGLRNRRALLHDLALAARTATPSQPKLLLLFDLNGFKLYNDTFGHPAGDALLKRLGRKLADCASGRGETYRLGGDEFCALLDAEGDPTTLAVELAQALLEAGEHFTIGSSYGEVLLGVETNDIEEALRIADQRLYAQKTLVVRPTRPEWRDVLLGLLRERDPQLGLHVQEVANLAIRVGQRLSMSEEELANLGAAAELHDIGKTAIPEAILEKPTALDSEERAFIERHTLIGERILAAAPTGRAVAAIVRATHERWDGDGYPDRLAGQDIPIAARIIAICDAYNAMTSDRSYRKAISHERAFRELQRCAGSQFDPQVTEVFLQMFKEATPASTLAASSTASR